jgi:acyl carrier protein
MMALPMEAKIVAAIVSVAQRRNAGLTTVTAEQPLNTLGLDSLDMAQLVAMLEAELGLDPFASTAISNVRTVGDLCDAYKKAASPS